MDFQAVRLESLTAVLAGDLVGLHIAPVLALDDAVRGQHNVSVRQFSRVCRALVAMKHHHLQMKATLPTLFRTFCACKALDTRPSDENTDPTASKQHTTTMG